MGGCASAPQADLEPQPGRAVRESASTSFSVGRDEEADANFGLTTHTVLKVRSRSIVLVCTSYPACMPMRTP